MDRVQQFRHTGVVKTTESSLVRPGSVESSASGAGVSSVRATSAPEGQTRSAVVTLLLEEGPITASDIGTRLGLSAAGVRRHLDALIDAGEARITTPAGARQRGRGRPAKHFQLTAAGRNRLGHTYDDLAGAAMRQLRKIGGDAAIETFARQRVNTIVADVEPATGSDAHAVEDAADRIADAFSAAGFSATTRQVGNGVQICQHHCPVSHVASEFPELCEAEQTAFAEILGTHVQRLATIANGNCACTTHVPLSPTRYSNTDSSDKKTPDAQPRVGERPRLRKEPA
ncbi:MAG: transcriptional regulator [Rhodococcus sp. (in: high G+C Gram-positive bacteria)]|nr:metalloregulator ArsR/SmtB family transcription factor [Rhodococcus sp. (in: high G+C Gram-positive bacteria)]MDI6628525.1 transcriptional regulator [Rhodococcus sp. (in: high G+C Gram-positive bacteria)]